ncbi:MAG: toll/interleukin-1 receptor domain-containing protein [Verrucomicrobiaceae bacterium]|nr:toll/interleukin-1 receptor domain-containing protein [Verrucomicrobiaceae bacterium]
MSTKTVFISYRRDSTGKLFGRSIKEALTHFGYDVFLDVDRLDAGKWAAQILTQVPLRSHFLLLLTPGSLDRCAQEDDWVRKELLAAIHSGRNIVPVREESVNLDELNTCCPECVKALFDYQIATVQHAGFESDIKMLVERFIPPHKAPAPKAESAVAMPHTVPADISRILRYAPAELIGRESDLSVLSVAWEKVRHATTPRPHILTFVALGGEGKTSLVAKWAAELAAQDWPGCDAAFAWSFYSQGTREQMAASSDLFLKEALNFFALDDKDREFAESSAGAFEKGQRLAHLVGQRRSLLILDGLEPLQYAPTAPTPGELKDQGLAALLKGLAAASHGLCVVTTRYSLPDLRAFWQSTAPEVKLLRLSRDAGVHLLKTLGVRGTAQEFAALVEDVKGHALTLTLLGSYLTEFHTGDIRKRDLVKLEVADEEIEVLQDHPHHVFNVLDAYVKEFEDASSPRPSPPSRDGGEGGRRPGEGERAQRMLALLRLMGLFDRPATADCLEALWKKPAIPGLTEPLVELNESHRNSALKRLEAAKLLTVNRDAAGALDSLDAHPHLREYFARQLRTQQPDAWRAAHRRLYEHLCASTKEGDQPTIEDLQPLYQAVAHGCQAGLQQEAYEKVYFERIRRQNEYYSVRKLGAFGADLGAIACFFDEPWKRISPALEKEKQALVFSQSGTWLRALGRLREALEPMRTCLEIGVHENDWKRSAIRASNLSELELTLGEVAGAVGDAEQSVTYADRSGDAFWRMGTRTAHADALHQAGRRAGAETRFREAEQMQKERQPAYPLLYSLQGFQYCDLLLAAPERAAWQSSHHAPRDERGTAVTGNAVDSSKHDPHAEAEAHLAERDGYLGRCRAVSQRAAQTLDWSVNVFNFGLLSIALDHLTLGRAALYAAILQGGAGSPLPAADALAPPDAPPRPDAQRRARSDAPYLDTALAPPDSPPRPDTQRRARSDAPYLDTARRELDAAVSGLRRAGTTHHIPLGLLTRAWLRFLTGARTGPDSAQADLDEAWEIAERGPMRLHMADVLLTRARLFGVQRTEVRDQKSAADGQKYPWESAEADLAEAERLIKQCGYHRRDEELADAKRALGVG